jgi:hypothetical protein
MNSNTREFKGSCHCGALSVFFKTAKPPAQWSVRACQCRFCRAHGALTTSDPSGQLTFDVDRPESLQHYRFGLKTADFLLCSRCGVYLGAQIETTRGAFGIVNLRTLVPRPDGLAEAAPADYTAENSSDRLERRAKRWTPLTQVV